jgi:hypothetical protein
MLAVEQTLTRWQQIQQLPLWVAAVGIIVFFIILKSPFLKTTALHHGPNRSIGLAPADLLIALGLLIFAAAAFVLFAQLLNALSPPAADQASTLRTVTLTLLSQFMTLGPLAAYLLWRASRVHRGLRRIGLVPRRPIFETKLAATALVFTIPLLFALLIIASAVGILLGYPPRTIGHVLLDTLAQSNSPLATALLLLSAIVIAPIFEECVYRGLLQSTLAEWLGRSRRGLAIFLAAFLFAIVHLGATPPHAIPALFAFGLILGYLYERTGSLLPSILLHAGFNAFNVAMVLLMVSQTA